MSNSNMLPTGWAAQSNGAEATPILCAICGKPTRYVMVPPHGPTNLVHPECAGSGEPLILSGCANALDMIAYEYGRAGDEATADELHRIAERLLTIWSKAVTSGNRHYPR